MQEIRAVSDAEKKALHSKKRMKINMEVNTISGKSILYVGLNTLEAQGEGIADPLLDF